MQTRTMLEWALRYASQSFEVFPLRPICGEGQCRQWDSKGADRNCQCGKAPATIHGKDDATTNEELITTWWTLHPECGIGMRPPPGVIVIDIDPRNGGDLDQIGIVPPTLTAETGSGGWHLFFTFSGLVRGKVADAVGIDIKSNSGYVVAAPSIHPCGGRYRWIDHSKPAPLPPQLIRRVARLEMPPPFPGSARALAGVEGILNFLETGGSGSAPGDRNGRLFWAANRFVADGHDLELLPPVGAAIGLDPVEVERTIASAVRSSA